MCSHIIKPSALANSGIFWGRPQKVGWRDSLARWLMVGLPIVWLFSLLASGPVKAELLTDYQNAGIIQADIPASYLETRGTFVAILIRALEKRAGKQFSVPATSGFTDIQSSSVYTEIVKAESIGILSNSPDGKFNPANPISRAEALAFTTRTFEYYKGSIFPTPDFAPFFVDLPADQSGWYDTMQNGAFQSLASGYTLDLCAGVVNNFPNATRCFKPDQQVIRSESVEFVEKLVIQLNSTGTTDTPIDNGSAVTGADPSVSSQDVVTFNATGQLLWNDYKRVTHEYETLVVGEGWPSCAPKSKSEQYVVNIPFKQTVTLEPSSRSKPDNQCSRHDVEYREKGGDWILIDTIQNLYYEGDLEFSLSPRSGSGWGDGCASYCWATVNATLFDKIATTSQQKQLGPYSESIHVVRWPQELARMPLPTTQFTPQYMRKEDPSATISDDIQYGEARDFSCQFTTDKPSDVRIWCVRQENEFVVYGYTLAAQNGPLAPFASIGLAKSSGKKDGVIKVVKWKDDEFQKGHDLIEFIGQAVDIDGQVVEYRWESDKDGVIGNQPSFFYTNLSLGLHTISFKAKDNDGLWSNVVTKRLEVVKPPLLLVHGYRGDDTESTWSSYSKDFLDNYYPIETVTLGPKDSTSISEGASVLSEKLAELKAKYGVPKINLLTYSWGGLVSRQYIQNLGYRNNVNKLVMLGTPNHGSSIATLLGNSLKRPDEMGVHYTIPIGVALLAATVLTPEEILKMWQDMDKDQGSGGEYIYEMIPGSSVLRSLNGNKKDEGYVGDEPNDNISTKYGNNVQYFNTGATSLPSLTHWHFEVPFTGIQVYEIVIPTLSFDTDTTVSKQSMDLDNVPMNLFGNDWTATLKLAAGAGLAFGGDQIGKIVTDEVSSKIGDVVGNVVGDVVADAVKKVAADLMDQPVWHSNLPRKKETLGRAVYYLGDDPPEASSDANQLLDVSKALASHVIYAPANGELSPLAARDTVQQEFEVDSSIKNLMVVLNASLAEGAERPFTFRLVSPSGTIIDEDTQLDNVAYLNSNPLFYVIADAEVGTWTAIIKSKTSETINYALGVMGETNFWVGMGEGTHVKPGKPFTINAYTQKEGKPVSGLQVKATLFKNVDEGDRIGSKYGSQRRDLDPVEVSLNDMGDGRYEVEYQDTLESGVYRVFITATDPATNASREVFSTFFVEYEYDLSTQSADLSFSNETPAHHETVTISANIHNDTNLEAKGVEVWFTDGSLGKEGTVIGKTTIDIAAGGSTTASAEWPALAGKHEIFVIVSPMDTFLEQNLTNNTASKVINVADNPPIANAGPDQISRFDSTKQVHANIFLDGSGSNDEFPLARYEWDLNTAMDTNGDGIPDNDVDFIGALQSIPAGTYPGIGQYTVKLTVFDRSQQTTSDTLTIAVKDEYDVELPIAVIGETQILEVGKSIRFDGSTSSDNFGIATYVWDIDTTVDSNGDGISDNDIDLVGMSPILEVEDTSKVYNNVKLTVMDTAGHSVSTTTTDQTSVSGEEPILYQASGIIDNNGTPVAGVTIQIGVQTTITDANGHWQIAGLLADNYVVTASKDGYGVVSQTVEVGQGKEVGIKLTLSSLLKVETTYTVKEVGQGNHITYIVTITNLGTKMATGIIFTDIIMPAGSELLTIQADSSGSGKGNFNNKDCDKQTASCKWPDLAPNASIEVEVVVKNKQGEAPANIAQVVSDNYPAGFDVIPEDLVETVIAVPVTVTPAVTLEPVTPEPKPVTPEPVAPSPAPVTPEPVAPSPAPVTPTPAPMTEPVTPEPVTLTPVPVTAAPVTPTPVPAIPAPVTAAPVTPTPAPAILESVTPTPAPVTAASVTPTPAPAIPESVTPTPVPVMSEPTPPATVVPPTPPVVFISIAACPTEGSLDVACNAGGQKIQLEEILPSGQISNGMLEKTLTSQGWVSNLTITTTGKLIGGTVTGYIKNQGVMLDFDFQGMSIIGGSLGGNLQNTSRVGGFFQDVTFLANTHLTGGYLKGTIKGDKNAPALLEQVRVKSGSHLSGVKLGKGVKLEKGVVVEDSEVLE